MPHRWRREWRHDQQFRNLTGSAFADTLTGSSLANIIKGGDGNDAIPRRRWRGPDQWRRRRRRSYGRGRPGPLQLHRRHGVRHWRGQPRHHHGLSCRTDKINVSQLDANAIGGTADGQFTFIATRGAAFTGAPGEIKFFTQNGNTVVAFNLNADTVAEFQIELRRIVDPTAGDFIL